MQVWASPPTFLSGWDIHVRSKSNLDGEWIQVGEYWPWTCPKPQSLHREQLPGLCAKNHYPRLRSRGSLQAGMFMNPAAGIRKQTPITLGGQDSGLENDAGTFKNPAADKVGVTGWAGNTKQCQVQVSMGYSAIKLCTLLSSVLLLLFFSWF